MNLLELNDEELKSFLEDGVPLELLRNIYVNTPKLAQKLKGFRPNKAAKQVLVNTSFSLIKTQKDVKLIGILTSFYNDNNESIKKSQKEYEGQGYSETIAMALSIEEATNEAFRPIYYKLEHFDETKQKAITENINILNLIKNISSETIRESLKKQLAKHKTLIETLNDELKETKKTINSINNEELNHSIEEVNKKIEFSLKKEREYVDKKIEQLVQNDVVMKLQDQIDFLKQYIEKISVASSNKNYTINVVENEEYEEFDEFLPENIGDIIENVVKNNEFDVLREYLVEVIFSKKPIIVSEKNSE